MVAVTEPASREAAAVSAGPRVDYGMLRLRRLRNREGYLAWVLHRVTGLGVLGFLCLHIVDTSLMLQGPAAYNQLVKNVYQQWWFQPLEVALGAALIYHTLNGLRVILLDLWSGAITHDRTLRRIVAWSFLAIMVPLAAVMVWPFIRTH